MGILKKLLSILYVCVVYVGAPIGLAYFTIYFSLINTTKNSLLFLLVVAVVFRFTQLVCKSYQKYCDPSFEPDMRIERKLKPHVKVIVGSVYFTILAVRLIVDLSMKG